MPSQGRRSGTSGVASAGVKVSGAAALLDVEAGVVVVVDMGVCVAKVNDSKLLNHLKKKYRFKLTMGLPKSKEYTYELIFFA